MTDLKFYITNFLAEKHLTQNSRMSYKYDLEQFVGQIGDKLDDYSLRLYQESLSHLKPSAQKRKCSSVNQFLYYLYINGKVDHFYKLKTVGQASIQTKEGSLIDLECLYQDTDYTSGQLIALLILELGLTPSEIAELKVKNIDKEFQILTVKKSNIVRILPISDRLMSYLNGCGGTIYLFENLGKTYTRQWFFVTLSTYLSSLGLSELSAQTLREQYILRQQESGVSLLELAKKLGLKSTNTLEKYYKNGY